MQLNSVLWRHKDCITEPYIYIYIYIYVGYQMALNRKPWGMRSISDNVLFCIIPTLDTHSPPLFQFSAWSNHSVYSDPVVHSHRKIDPLFILHIVWALLLIYFYPWWPTVEPSRGAVIADQRVTADYCASHIARNEDINHSNSYDEHRPRRPPSQRSKRWCSRPSGYTGPELAQCGSKQERLLKWRDWLGNVDAK